MELVKITEKNDDETVSARELHEVLEIKTEFEMWISSIVEKYNFIENEDFTRVYQKCNTLDEEQVIVDYILKISMVKEITMIVNTEIGKQAREYFIKCEEAWNSEERVVCTKCKWR